MILVDHQIRELIEQGYIEIDPFDESRLQAASIDITVSKYFRKFQSDTLLAGDFSTIVDVKQPNHNLTKLVAIDEDNCLILKPHEFILASSNERFKFGANIVGRLEGKSSLGRLGLLIHSTAGFFDPGFAGTATLELFNALDHPITIYPGMPIGQMSFFKASAEAKLPYNCKKDAKYQDQKGPVASMYFRNFE